MSLEGDAALNRLTQWAMIGAEERKHRELIAKSKNAIRSCTDEEFEKLLSWCNNREKEIAIRIRNGQE